VKLRKAYRFRMRPTKTQEAGLYRMAGARRFVYNWALSRRKDHYAEHGKGISARELSSELSALKSQPETLWLKEADSQMLQQALTDVDRATMRSSRGVAASPVCAPRRPDTSLSVSPSASESRTAGYTSRR
jgi:putative transposase